MDVENNKKTKDKNFENSDYYDVVSKVLTFVDKVDKIKKNNNKKKGDLNGN